MLFTDLHWYWRNRIEGYDFGENDVTRLFDLLITVGIVSVAVAFLVTVVGVVQLCRSGSRRRGGLNTLCGILALLAVFRPWA